MRSERENQSTIHAKKKRADTLIMQSTSIKYVPQKEIG